jgi:GntR family transcriptional regulator/MocR family aminotransferase
VKPVKSQSRGPVADRRRGLFIPSITLDRALATPLYLQVRSQFAAAVAAGGHTGERLPSTRQLARLLGVSRNTIVTAYEDLVASGIIEGRAGSRMVVSAHRATAPGPFDPQRILRDALYPARTLTVEDPDGTALYLIC